MAPAGSVDWKLPVANSPEVPGELVREPVKGKPNRILAMLKSAADWLTHSTCWDCGARIEEAGQSYCKRCRSFDE